MEERRAAGPDHLALATDLLQAARRRSPTAGVWEAAEVQWASRRDRHADPDDATYWLDDGHPVAAVLVNRPGHSGGDRLGLDVLRVDPTDRRLLELAWPRALARLTDLGPATVEMLIDDAESDLAALAAAAGFVATDDGDVTAWMPADARARVVPPPDGFRLVARSEAGDAPHPVSARSGPDAVARLAACSLYRPDLDLAVGADDGTPAAYGLFWADPTTGVGVVEPMRTEDAVQGRGLGRAVLTAGLDRLAAAGCDRLKISYDPTNGPARHLYLSVGFTPVSTARTWVRVRSVGQ